MSLTICTVSKHKYFVNPQIAYILTFLLFLHASTVMSTWRYDTPQPYAQGTRLCNLLE